MPIFENSKGQQIKVPQAHDFQSWFGNALMREKAVIGMISAKVDMILNVLGETQEPEIIKSKEEANYERIQKIRGLGTPNGWDQDQQDAIMTQTSLIHEDQLQIGELKQRMIKLKE